VGINSDGSAPDNSAMLDVKATDRGLLIPRISTTSRNQIPSPATGLIIYNTTTNQFNYYNGNYWYQSEAAVISSTVGTLNVGGGVSINASPDMPPENSAMLDINNPTRGILIPGTTPEMIATPATGLIIYNTATNQLNYYNGIQWIALCSFSTEIAGAGGSQPFLGVAIKTDNSSPHHSAMLDVSATDKGVLIPRLTNAERDAILPVAGLAIYNTTVNNIEFYNGAAWYQFSTSLIAVPTSGTHVPSATQIIWNWNAVTGASGYKWNTTNDYATSTDIGNTITKTETALACNTGYTRYAWAYNSCGYSSPITMSQTTSACFTCGSSITINHLAGTVAPVAKIVTYGTVTNIPGEPSKCWITSNLGADHQATAKNDATEASAGWYFQFNRKQGYKHDGIIRIPATTWISSISENSSWVAANDPCTLEFGSGWRIPTGSEWGNVDATGNWTSSNGPWSSALKLHAAGSLHYSDGSLQSRGINGSYWSTDMDNATNAWLLGFSTGCNINSYNKAFAVTVRCIKN
jgi:hypothetical protein